MAKLTRTTNKPHTHARIQTNMTSNHLPGQAQVPKTFQHNHHETSKHIMKVSDFSKIS